MAATVMYRMILICVLVISAGFPTARCSRLPNFLLHQVTAHTQIKGNSNTNNMPESAYVKETATIDAAALLDDKLPKSGDSPSAPSACHNMVIDTVGAARYSC